MRRDQESKTFCLAIADGVESMPDEQVDDIAAPRQPAAQLHGVKRGPHRSSVATFLARQNALCGEPTRAVSEASEWSVARGMEQIWCRLPLIPVEATNPIQNRARPDN